MTGCNSLRRALTSLLGDPDLAAEAGLVRPPALRRSRLDDWLYATDAPLCGGQTGTVLRRLAEAGWETAVTDAWIQLRCPLPPWPEGAFAGPFGPEAACCLSLLSRRPQGTARDAGVEFRLLKAGEKGASAYEAACRQLHRDWARRLARGQALPRISLRYFGAAEDAETF